MNSPSEPKANQTLTNERPCDSRLSVLPVVLMDVVDVVLVVVTMGAV